MKKQSCIRVCLAGVIAAITFSVSAHPLLTPVADHRGQSPYYAGQPIDEMLFSLPSSKTGPKLWTEMSAKERAEIWPFLSQRMQRYYWRSMTEPDRQAMKDELPPPVREKFRKRYASPNDIRPVDEHGHVVRHRLSPEERAKMRQQIREMHIEFYRFHHQRPSVAIDDAPASSQPDDSQQ